MSPHFRWFLCGAAAVVILAWLTACDSLPEPEGTCHADECRVVDLCAGINPSGAYTYRGTDRLVVHWDSVMLNHRAGTAIVFFKGIEQPARVSCADLH